MIRNLICQEKKLNTRLDKKLYKVLLIIMKIIPFVLSINETIFTILHYYEIPCYSLNFIGGFSVLFLVQLYIMSYVFQYCIWHRVPLHYVTTVNILALYDTFVGIPLDDLQLLRMYLIIAGFSILWFIYLRVKKKC